MPSGHSGLVLFPLQGEKPCRGSSLEGGFVELQQPIARLPDDTGDVQLLAD
jgi:hypothetical protein